MKRYTEYTNEELIELTQEEIQNLIELEIAFAGIMPVMEPQLPNLASIDLKKELTLYEVNGMLFKNAEEAQQVLKMDVWEENYDYGGAGYDYKYGEKKDLNMSVVMYYEKEQIWKVRQALTENKRLNDSYNQEKSAYDKFIKETKNIRESVRAAVDNAWTWKNDLDHAKSVYEKYLRLADGNEAIAQSFFRNAFKVRNDVIDAMFPKVADVQAVADDRAEKKEE